MDVDDRATGDAASRDAPHASASIGRRLVLAGGAATFLSGTGAAKGGRPMYGLIGQMKAAAGKRAELAAILLEGTSAMPGCLSYIVAEDQGDPDALWITEVWDSRDSHAASLALPAVQAAIAQGRPLIAGFGHRFETSPLGGAGL
jgi:quinol monooxygenase YgiN